MVCLMGLSLLPWEYQPVDSLHMIYNRYFGPHSVSSAFRGAGVYRCHMNLWKAGDYRSARQTGCD